MTDTETKSDDPLRRFLDRKYRQVWAVHRSTGERIFLDRGEATDQMRAYARAELKCPVPACTVDISARGRSKRDHFFHLGDSGHGEGESEWHLQAKALLADWANRQPGYAAREEETVHVPDAGRIRRADVMATAATGRKVAFEVEYKGYKPEHWQAKQADYNTVEITCSWIFGHLNRYLRQPRKPADWPADQTWDRLQWVELTAAVARAGRPILFINPVERAVVSAIQRQEPLASARTDPNWWRRADHVGDRLAHPDSHYDPVLVLDPLDACTLDPDRGLITPTMRRVEAERAHLRKLAASAQVAAEAAATRQREEAIKRRDAQEAAREAAEAERRRLAARSEEEREAARAYGDQMRAQHAIDWDNHPLRARIIAARGTIPDFLAQELPGDRAVYAHPEHWHSQLFTDLVLGNGTTSQVGTTVEFTEILRMLRNARIRLPKGARRSFAAIRDFLYHLRDHGYLLINDGGVRHILSVTVIADLNTAKPRSVARVNGAIPMPPGPARKTLRQELHEDRKHTAWENSLDRSTLLCTYGELPKIMAATTPDETTPDIRVTPVHWHTHLYLLYVHESPGATFTLRDATRTLVTDGLARHGRDLPNAVHSFFLRLEQHGCLEVHLDWTLIENTYTVIDPTL